MELVTRKHNVRNKSQNRIGFRNMKVMEIITDVRTAVVQIRKDRNDRGC